MWQQYIRPTTLEEVLETLDRYAATPGEAAIIAGGTDVVVEYEHGRRSTPVLIDITALDELRYVRAREDSTEIGALATHNDLISSPVAVERLLPLAQACLEVGAPQLRTRATIAGNLVTASPANDTITPLTALDATLVLKSSLGEREVPISSFYRGVRRTVLAQNELITAIRIPHDPARRGLFLKLGLRRAQAISVIDLAVALSDRPDGFVDDVRIALGSVAPTIIRTEAAESLLNGAVLTPSLCREAGKLARDAINPIGDVRGSADYRRATVERLVTHALERLASRTEREDWPEKPILLETERSAAHRSARPQRESGGAVIATINGTSRHLPGAWRKTLLDALREDAGLTGTKEGCGEGECGACTVWLDGQAVMSCLVPAAQAHGAKITTIEGLAHTANAELHPLQQSFIDRGAVQCGYCIPGMVMAGAKLLEEVEKPDLAAIQTGLSGNICRCTGYRKILDAVAAAGGMS
jgi:carbon-monoxide dehydrogenase medium subunit